MTHAAKRREIFNSSLQAGNNRTRCMRPVNVSGRIVICESEPAMIGVSVGPLMRVTSTTSDGGLFTGGREMKDLQAHLEKLRVDAAECARIRDLADSASKRELFGRLAEHLTALAADVERAMNAMRPNGDTR
jgi:hypothetical protein